MNLLENTDGLHRPPVTGDGAPRQCPLDALVSIYADVRSLLMTSRIQRPVVPGNVAVLQPGCNKGKYSHDFAVTACEECPIGQFASDPGAMQCSTCPEGLKTLDVGSIVVQNCSICT